MEIDMNKLAGRAYIEKELDEAEAAEVTASMRRAKMAPVALIPHDRKTPIRSLNVVVENFNPKVNASLDLAREAFKLYNAALSKSSSLNYAEHDEKIQLALRHAHAAVDEFITGHKKGMRSGYLEVADVVNAIERAYNERINVSIGTRVYNK